jgi:hypothetical protein
VRAGRRELRRHARAGPVRRRQGRLSKSPRRCEGPVPRGSGPFCFLGGPLSRNRPTRHRQ